MQLILQFAVSAGYQVSFRLLNAGSFGPSQHRRRLIVVFAKHGLPMLEWPAATHLFKGAGGYPPQGGPCMLDARGAVARRGVPTGWHTHVRPLCMAVRSRLHAL